MSRRGGEGGCPPKNVCLDPIFRDAHRPEAKPHEGFGCSTLSVFTPCLHFYEDKVEHPNPTCGCAFRLSMSLKNGHTTIAFGHLLLPPRLLCPAGLFFRVTLLFLVRGRKPAKWRDMAKNQSRGRKNRRMFPGFLVWTFRSTS